MCAAAAPSSSGGFNSSAPCYASGRKPWRNVPTIRRQRVRQLRWRCQRSIFKLPGKIFNPAGTSVDAFQPLKSYMSNSGAATVGWAWSCMRAAVQPSQERELALLHELRRNVNVLLAAPLKSDVADDPLVMLQGYGGLQGGTRGYRVCSVKHLTVS